MSTTATPVAPAPVKAPAAAAASTPATDFASIAKSGVPELLKTREVHVFKKLQARTDTDSGSVVDEGRCQQFAHAFEAIAKDPKLPKFPPIKVMKVLDAPGHKDEEVYVCWDGMHTLRGAEIAKVAELDALVWSGTFAQAQFLAATRANREHEKNGKPLSSKDKIHAVSIFAAAYISSGAPKSEWPSNRQVADICGCSRQLVNEIDPFNRGAGDKREATAARKRAERAAKSPKAPGHFEIVNKAGELVASYDANTEDEALKRHKEVNPNADLKELVARKEAAAAAPKPGSEKPVGFDWASMDSHLGYLIRGTDAMGDIFDLKGKPEFVAALQNLNHYAAKLNEFRKKYTANKAAKAAAAANGTPAAAAAPK